MKTKQNKIAELICNDFCKHFDECKLQIFEYCDISGKFANSVLKIIEEDKSKRVHGIERKITETVFSSGDVVIPMVDVQHIEKLSLNGKSNGILVITKHTSWNFENDTWENPIYISTIDGKDKKFLEAWCYYRYECDGMKGDRR